MGTPKVSGRVPVVTHSDTDPPYPGERSPSDRDATIDDLVKLTDSRQERHQPIWWIIDEDGAATICRCGKKIRKKTLDDVYDAYRRHERSSKSAKTRKERAKVSL